jgi:outer membrane murein-binding lipoprotein Lpp
MKKLILLAIAAVGVIACNNNTEVENTVSPIASLEAWLDSIDNLGDVTAEQMTAIEEEYNTATAGLDMEGMSEEDKKSLDLAKGRWETFKLNNSMGEDEGEDMGEEVVITEEHKKEIYTEFLGDVTMADASDYSFMTADNALAVYQNFSDKAKMHKDDYSSDDWNFVKAIYEKIDARKNEIEKDLKGTDNLKIAKIKTTLAPMFKIGKIKAKIEEKVDQKEAEAEAAE